MSLGAGNVVISGVGLVSALGNDPSAFHVRLAKGEVAIGLTPWPLPDGQTGFFAGVQDFKADLPPNVAAGTDRFSQFALVAAAAALADAGIDPDGLDPERTAVILGTSMGGLTSLVEGQHALDTSGPQAMNRKMQLQIWPNMAAAQIAMRYGLHGPCLTICTACASSVDAVGHAARLVDSGQVDVAITGGSEAWGPLSFPPAYAVGQSALGMLPKDDDPLLASRPFDRDRIGISNGEGAGLFVLESRSYAQARGARRRAVVRGYASLADSYHPSSPEPSGVWEAKAMSAAAAEAGVPIDAVYAHGTGTPKGDLAEILAINDVFGERVADVSVTSIKGHLGHAAGAAGALSAVAAVLGLERQEVVPTAGTTNPDDAIAFDLVIGAGRSRSVRAVQVNAFGFGGQNASMVVSADGA